MRFLMVRASIEFVCLYVYMSIWRHSFSIHTNMAVYYTYI